MKKISGRLVKVEMTFARRDESNLRRTLEGPQVRSWDESVMNLCQLADIHGAKFDWGSFKWNEKVVRNSARKKH